MMRTRNAAKVALPRLTQLLAGYRFSSVLVAACELGVFAALREKALTHAELALACACAPDGWLRSMRPDLPHRHPPIDFPSITKRYLTSLLSMRS